jgi:hypothetical protein
VPWRLTLRVGPKVRRSSFDSLDDAVRALRDGLAAAPRREPVDLRVRQFEPIQQVAARGELAGPRRARGGVDVRGDGSPEAFVGKLRRRVVAAEPGEDAYAALRRVLELKR